VDNIFSYRLWRVGKRKKFNYFKTGSFTASLLGKSAQMNVTFSSKTAISFSPPATGGGKNKITAVFKSFY
jgi:hypothetical protein